MVEAADDFDDGMLYGDDLKDYVNKLREKAEAFFAQAGKDPLEIYRIEQFEPVRQAEETHGKFYQGDSYVVLKRGRASYDIHYWHGKEATSVSTSSHIVFIKCSWVTRPAPALLFRTKWARRLPCQCSCRRTWTWARATISRIKRWRPTCS